MNLFFHLSSLCANSIAKFFLVVFCILVLILSSCHELELHQGHDITEDLHHRLISGLFEPGKDPFIIHIRSRGRNETSRPIVESYVRFSSVNGSFWVKSNEGASVIMYMDTEATFSHIHFFVDKRHQVFTIYVREPTYPVQTMFGFN